MLSFEQYKQGAAVLKDKLNGFEPQLLIILGSGLGGLGEYVADPIVIPYRDIPYMGESTAIGHAGRFIAGKLGEKKALLMQGRLHIYEGHAPWRTAYPVRLAKLIGIESMVVTNAAGGINASFSPGELMLIKDFINLNRPNPLIGENIDEFGVRFPDMSYVFDLEYQRVFRSVVEEAGDILREGVYFYCIGPQYETPAEIRAMRILGADAVGMSTVPECIVARHCGMRTLGISLITNMAAGILDKPLSGAEVIETGLAASQRFCSYMIEFINRI